MLSITFWAGAASGIIFTLVVAAVLLLLYVSKAYNDVPESDPYVYDENSYS